MVESIVSLEGVVHRMALAMVVAFCPGTHQAETGAETKILPFL